MNEEIIIQILSIISYVVIGFFIIFAWHPIFFFILTCFKAKKIPHSDKYTKFAVLVPARNESKVISHLMRSLDRQTYPREYFDVYFIVEDENDETIIKAKRHGYKYFVRPPISPNRRTKGYALQECINYFYENNLEYDAYMIFDADNVLEERYLEVMNDVRHTGVEVGSGYRNFTNANKNIFASTSAILFTYMNNVTSRARSILFKKCILSGTGYFINADIIKEAGGWIFTGMTEDTELTSYCYQHDIHMKYVKAVCFYDEQASKFKVWYNQLIRWIWGYLQRSDSKNNNGKDHKTLPKPLYKIAKFEYRLSFFPIVIVIAMIFMIGFAYLILAFIQLGFYVTTGNGDFYILFFLALLYMFIDVIIFAVVALGQVIREGHRIRIGFFYGITTILMYWFYFLNIVIAFLDGLFHPKKRTTWKVIPHSGKITNKKAKKVAKKHE